MFGIVIPLVWAWAGSGPFPLRPASEVLFSNRTVVSGPCFPKLCFDRKASAFNFENRGSLPEISSPLLTAYMNLDFTTETEHNQHRKIKWADPMLAERDHKPIAGPNSTQTSVSSDSGEPEDAWSGDQCAGAHKPCVRALRAWTHHNASGVEGVRHKRAPS